MSVKCVHCLSFNLFPGLRAVAEGKKKLHAEPHEFRAKSPLSKLSLLTRVSRRTHKVSQTFFFNLHSYFIVAHCDRRGGSIPCTVGDVVYSQQKSRVSLKSFGSFLRST